MSQPERPLHKLNNLLVPLVGYRDLLERRFEAILEDDPEHATEIAEIRQLVLEMCDAGEHASHLVSAMHAEKHQASEPPAPTNATMTGHHVLVVEDHAAVRQGMVRALREAGYQVLEAATPEAGHVLLQDGGAVDAVISDAAVAASFEDMPIVLMSDHPPAEATHSCVGLRKPFSNRELVAAVQNLLSGRE